MVNLSGTPDFGWEFPEGTSSNQKGVFLAQTVLAEQLNCMKAGGAAVAQALRLQRPVSTSCLFFSLHICCFGFLSCFRLVLAPKFYYALQMSVQSSPFSVLWGVDVALILSAPDCFVAPVSKAFWPFVSFMA